MPNRYGTFEIQYYSILNDLWFYFDPEYNNAKKIKLSELLNVFRLLGYVYKDIDKKTDQETINIFNYLVNILYIYKDSGLIELSIFHLIIYSCLSFDKDSANNRLKHIKENYNYINYTIYINEIEAIYYDKQITGEETIKILGMNKKSIEIKAEYINWRVNEFDSLFDSENFMLCFRFPYNSDINYIKMDETFFQGYDELFNKVIKSQVVKQAMMFDDEARKFKYLYSNEDILKEIKNNTYLVCLPFDNYYGFSDKNAFVVYLKSNFSFKEIKKTLATFDNLIRTQYHEYKHISRIYYHMVDDNLELKTPTFSLSQFKGDRNYINNIYQESLEIKKKKTANISENSKCFQKTFDEYGDLVEYAINGFKVEVQMIRSVLSLKLSRP